MLIAAVVAALAFGLYRAADRRPLPRHPPHVARRASELAPVPSTPVARDAALASRRRGPPAARRSSWGSGPRCCSSPRRSARRAAPPGASWPRSPRWSRAWPTSRSTPSTTSSWYAGLGILRTPTTLVLDAAGREVTRAAGAPRKEQVLAALGAASLMSTMWIGRLDMRDARLSGRGSAVAYSLVVMSSTMLTKRRAVDHCRVRSSLCRMS